MQNILKHPVAAAIAMGALAPSLTAQVPPGWCVVSANRENGSTFSGDGGIYLTHPRNPMAMHAVTGLPIALTGAGLASPLPPPGSIGANCVLLHASGDLIVGPAASAGASVDLWRITVTKSLGTGFAATTATPLNLGLAGANGASITQMAFVTDDVVLLSGVGVATGPMAPASPIQLALVDLVAMTITSLSTGPLPYPPGLTGSPTLNAVAFDQATGTASIGLLMDTPNMPPYTPATSWICTSPLTNPMTFALGPWMPGYVTNIALRTSGGVTETIASASVGTGTGNPVIHVFSGGSSTTLLPNAAIATWDIVNAITTEPMTGELLFCGNEVAGNAATGGVHLLEFATRTVADLSNTLQNGLRGPLSGIAVAPAIRDTGLASSCAGGGPASTWSYEPDPDKLPLAGNTSFFVECDHAPGATTWASLVVIGLAPIAPPPSPFPGCPGMQILVAPSFLDLMTLQPGKSRFTLPLPATLAPPLQIYFQSAHLNDLTLGNIDLTNRLEVEVL